MALTIKSLKKVIAALKEKDRTLDDLVPAILESEKLTAKMLAFHLNDEPISVIEPWMLRHLQFNEDCTQYRWKTDKKTIALLKKAGVVVDPEDEPEGIGES